MRKRLAGLCLVVALVATGCGRLGMGSLECEVRVRQPSAANILAAQSVPSARYTPCFRSLDLGWDGITFEAESGKAGIAVHKSMKVFLTAIVTETCDIGDATRVSSGHEDIAKYESIEQVPADVAVAVVGAGADEVALGRRLAMQWGEVTVEDRRLVFSVDRDTGLSMSTRVTRALADNLFVWVIDELDAADGRLEVRTPDGGSLSRVSPAEAVEFMEDHLPEVVYRGDWFFRFEGGCITYHFDADGRLAETVANDASANLGFYPAHELWDTAVDIGLIEEPLS